MRVTISELLGKTSAQEGNARESELYWADWARREAAKQAEIRCQAERVVRTIVRETKQPVEVLYRRRSGHG